MQMSVKIKKYAPAKNEENFDRLKKELNNMMNSEKANGKRS
jgi:hypothetical protein